MGWESEKYLENKIRYAVEKQKGMSIKLSSSLIKGLPDRLNILPGGLVHFVEVKSSGKKPTKMQQYVIGKLKELGLKVYIVDSKETFEQWQHSTRITIN